MHALLTRSQNLYSVSVSTIRDGEGRMTYYDSAGGARYGTSVGTRTSHMELLLILVSAVVVGLASFWAVAALMDESEERRAEDARLLMAALDQWPGAALNSTITVVEAT